MPQMSPLNWLILFIYFSVIFILFNSVNYFIMSYSNQCINKFKTNKQFYWKW